MKKKEKIKQRLKSKRRRLFFNSVQVMTPVIFREIGQDGIANYNEFKVMDN